MYVTACTFLAEDFEKNHDYDQAAAYRNKTLRARGL
jgi:hypothetical protein